MESEERRWDRVYINLNGDSFNKLILRIWWRVVVLEDVGTKKDSVQI